MQRLFAAREVKSIKGVREPVPIGNGDLSPNSESGLEKHLAIPKCHPHKISIVSDRIRAFRKSFGLSGLQAANRILGFACVRSAAGATHVAMWNPHCKWRRCAKED
jgi:hypothetical protein